MTALSATSGQDGRATSLDLPLVHAVVLNWNKAEQSAACVASLLRQQYPALRIIVVDNGSSRDSLAPLDQLDGKILLLKNETNLGFTGGVNTGMRQAMADGADYVWLVNNDAEPAADALRKLITVAEADTRIGLASPVILNADAADEIEFCGGIRDGTQFHATDDLATYQSWREESPDLLWLVGTALLLRRRLVETIGLFDERFFAYWEDNDYSVRSTKAHFHNVIVPDAVVRHWSGNPRSEPATKPPHYYYYMARNELLFVRKHVALRQAVKAVLWAAARQFRQIDRLRDYPAAADAVRLGLWDGCRGRGGAYDPGKRLSLAALCALRMASRMASHRR